MRRLLLGLALLAGFAAPAAAQSYVVGVEDLDYYPIYGLRNGEYAGAAREILDAFAAESGLSLTYRPLPVKRLFAELIGGEIDFKFPDNPYWIAEARVGKPITYSAPVIAYIDGVMVKPTRRGKGLEGFKTLGTVTGFTPFAWLKLVEAGQVQLVENAQMKALQRQVMADRVDGGYASIAVATHILENELKQPGELVFDPSLPHSKDAYFLSTTKHPKVIAAFNAWLAANAAKVAAIKAKYGAEKGVE